jgi:hypothetical protein
MLRKFLSVLLFVTTPAWASEEADFDPAQVSVVDAINCYLDAPTYNSFALAIVGEDNLAKRLGWRKVEGENPFLAEYELPDEQAITGTWATRRIAFSSSGVMAILDVADPEVVAADEEIKSEADAVNLDMADARGEASPEAKEAAAQVIGKAAEATSPFRKFLGQRVIVDETELANEKDAFGTHTVIARSISNVTSHPGKTLYGCSYRMELLDANGKPI